MLHHWLLGLALASLPFWWDDTPTWQFVDAQPLADVVDTDEITFNPLLSPDGSAVAWEAPDATCVYWFEDARSECFQWPENAALRSNRYNLASWSPDGRYIAQTENFFMMFRDSDIWVLDTQTGVYTDRTDEGYFGGLMSPDQPDDLPLDYLPTWNPQTGDLYFFRSQEREPVIVDTGYTLQLYKMPAAGGEPELVRDLTLAIPGPFAVFRPVAFNDDGTKLAIMVLPQNVRESPGSGIWVLDLANDGTDMVASLARLNTAMPSWVSDALYMPLDVQWAGDDLIIMLEDTQFNTGITRTPIYLDTETRQVTALVDYSAFEGRADYVNAWSSEPSVTNRAITGSVLPGGGSYWLLTGDQQTTETMAVYELPLPGSDAEPQLIAEIDEHPAPGQDALPTMSDAGKLLILHTLFTLEPAAE